MCYDKQLHHISSKNASEKVLFVNPEKKPTLVMLHRVTTVREKYLENEIYSKSGNFVNGEGNLERTLKVMEKSRNLKWLCQADLENLFILFKEGKRCTVS